MKKIFINEIPLYLCDINEASQIPKEDNVLIGRFFNLKTLHSYIDMMEKPNKFKKVVLFSEEPKQMWKIFKKFFLIIKAAGGVVKNQEGKILFIYRKKSWDLPKGKIDEKETKKAAAIREVQEETGIKNILIGEKICHTYHVYSLNNQRILKKSYWYEMTTTDLELTPQSEEDIEQAVWLSMEEFYREKRTVYKSIEEVLTYIK